jgi:thiosulfate/3-mercaptopyruvate sulfurtransferase
MKKLNLLILLLISGTFAVSQSNPILVDPQWVSDRLKDPKLVILQVNFLKMDYDREHIEGARFLWPESLAPDSPQGSFNAPDAARATEVLQGLGINNDSYVVLSHVRNEVSVTARMFLTLEHLGLKGRVSFLNGGLEAWKKIGFSVTKEVPATKKGNFKPRNNGLIVDKEYVLNTLKSDKGFVVDARMKRFYDGEPTGNPRDGHITGAKNIYFLDMVDQQTNTFKPLDSLQNYFAPVASKDKELVTYCFIGQTASVLYMAGRLLGYNMKLYDGSMQEWSRIEELPMEKAK